MSSLASEFRVVQKRLIDYATEAGWTHVPRKDGEALRGGQKGLVFTDVAREQLQKLNPQVLDADSADDLIRRLARVRPNISGNFDAWEFLTGLKTVFVPEENRERNVRFFDEENPENNLFHVTDEWSFTSGEHTIRGDVVFLINGVPVLIVEAKAATLKKGIAKSLDQVRRYTREASEFLAILQLFTLVQLVHFFYGATWTYSRKTLFNWKEESAGNYEQLVKAFFHPERILKIVSDYILFTRVDEELQKVVLRPHQIRATEKTLRRAADPTKRRGLIWHTQGSGKTYTMITVAKKIIEGNEFDNPTILLLVDRNELEAQLYGNLEALGFSHARVAGSKAELRQLLRDDTRGLIVSMIHKFDDISANINTRDNIFVLVDEAHRTTGGDLGNYLMGALPNATYVGFTGTPIDRSAHGKGTFKVFGADDDPAQPYLDKYSIRESIEDGATVQLHYALAPNELRIDRDVLEEEFLGKAEAEGISDVDELNKILDKAVNLKNMLKSPARVQRVAKFVADHFKETVEPMGFKAFLVAVDREACVRYKEALDEHLPADYSAVVMSSGHYDSEELSSFHISDEVEKQTRKAFRNPEKLPKILIVTAKLLTGFDAPILYAMYLDKPMRDHVLLQAIARVNRPYEEASGARKPAGFVLDFVGIFENLERALAFDSNDVLGVVQDLDVLKEHFAKVMDEGKSYLAIGSGLKDDKHAEAVLEHFLEDETKESFYAWFRQVEEVYEILSPDPFLRPFIDDFAALANIYRLLRASEYDPPDDDFARKTAELVQEHTRSGVIQAPEEIFELGPDALQKIAESDKPTAVKVFNLLKLIDKAVKDKSHEAPYLIPIGERAEAIVQRYRDRQMDTQQALEQLQLELGLVEKIERQRQETGLSAEGLTGFLLLEKDGVEKTLEIAKEMADSFESYPHWKRSEDQERELRKALYKSVLKTGTDHTEIVDRLLQVLKGESA